MWCRRKSRILAIALLTLWSGGAELLHASVDLEWRAAQPAVSRGELVEIGLYAVSDTELCQSVGAMEVILVWDASRLELVGRREPCEEDPCPPNTYNWMLSGFPLDRNGDSLNADCAPDQFCTPFSGKPYNDGNALFWALAKLTGPPASATDDGLWVSSFIFRTLSAGVGELGFAESLGNATRTLVVSGDAPGQEVTGRLGPPAQVVIVECFPPVVTAIGPRYLAVSALPTELPIGLLVSGDSGDPDISCVAEYVQTDGSLGAAPVWQLPDEWGTVHVRDTKIVPGSTYEVRTACGYPYGLNLFSEPGSAMTWLWGDVDDSATVNFDDITLVVDGAQGIFEGDTIPENLDLVPCRPDGLVDAGDIAAVQGAAAGDPFPCVPPCLPGLNLEDLAAFVACLGGPLVDVPVGCGRFESNADGHIDMADFQAFQTAFGQP